MNCQILISSLYLLVVRLKESKRSHVLLSDSNNGSTRLATDENNEFYTHFCIQAVSKFFVPIERKIPLKLGAFVV